jgi:hypothetical protein
MTCRRCSECPGADHHWIESVYGDEPINESSPSHICKHCDATGDECDACDGEGGEVVDIGERDNGGVALCPPCKGHGVVERAPGRGAK